MSIYIKNSGFTKTLIEKNNKKSKNELKWTGDYNGEIANISVAINDNNNIENLHMKLDNNDLMEILGIQPVNLTLEDRLTSDFFNQETQPLILKSKKMSKKSKKRKNSNAKKSKKRAIKK